jgi:hypothetical protein
MAESVRKSTLVEWMLRLAVGGVFVYAGSVKILDSQQFALDVQNYQLTSWTMSIVVAMYLPWLEIIASIALMTRKLYLGALSAMLGMTSVFLVAILSAWMRGLDITCGCFGRSDVRVSYPELIGRDLLLMAAIVALGLMEWRRGTRGASSG